MRGLYGQRRGGGVGVGGHGGAEALIFSSVTHQSVPTHTAPSVQRGFSERKVTQTSHKLFPPHGGEHRQRRPDLGGLLQTELLIADR